jgi:hypothetical protein
LAAGLRAHQRGRADRLVVAPAGATSAGGSVAGALCAVGLLCLTYTALLIGLIGGWLDPVRAPGPGTPSITDYSVAGLRALFASDGAITVGWTHYLALDLFTGLWIARDADAKGTSRLIQAPILLATYLAGPFGLLVWLLAREPAARREARLET